MKSLKLVVAVLFVVGICSPLYINNSVYSQSAPEAPTGFDNQTNGASTQAEFDADLAIFAEREEIDEGLGPLYNATACSDCHQNPVTGAISQITELRAGHFNGINFVDHPGGSLINDRAINANIQERVLGGNEVRTFRTSLNTLGDGFIEAIDSNVLAAIPGGQGAQAGTFIQVPVNEANNAVRGARFGWKNQHASLLSFSADAYLNEMGITSVLQPNENNILGVSSAQFDGVPDPEDPAVPGFPNGQDVQAFTNFMRSLRAPGRGPINADVNAGSVLFDLIGCAVCHTRNFTTALAGTVINGGAFTVPAALGNKIIHPFSDFALHNIGTSGGIGGEPGVNDRFSTTTIALWGVRTKHRFMMQGNAHTIFDAIQLLAG